MKIREHRVAGIPSISINKSKNKSQPHSVLNFKLFLTIRSKMK